MTEESRDTSGMHGDASGADASAAWRSVADALGTLGETIARATTEAIDDDENRRRMRELSEGLAALASRLGAAAGETFDAPVAKAADLAASAIAEPARDALTAASRAGAQVVAAGERAVDEVRPAVLDALRAANAKFKAVGSELTEPVAAAPASLAPVVTATTGPIPTASPTSLPAVAVAPSIPPAPVEFVEAPASITGRFAAVVVDKVGSLFGGGSPAAAPTVAEPEHALQEPSIHEWLFPEGAPETELELDTEPEPGPPVDHDTGTFAVIVAGAATDSEGASAPAPELELEPAPEVELEPEPEAESEVEPEPDPESDSELATAPQAELSDLAPELDPEPAPVADAVPAPQPAPQVSDPGSLEVVRLAHERFLAERRLAEEAANVARSRTRSERRKKKPARRQAPPSDDDATLW